MKTIPVQELAKLIHENARAHGFWDDFDFTNPACVLAKIAMIQTELGEAIQAYRNVADFSRIWHENDKPEGTPIELIGALFRILDLLQGFGIDIGELVEMVHRSNLKRPVKHGKQWGF